MKRTMTYMLLAILVLTSLMPVVSVFAKTEIKVLLNGKEIAFDQPPMIISGRTMIPVRIVAEALGIKGDWNNDTKTAVFSNNNTSIKLSAGNKIAEVNGMKVELDVSALIVEGRILIPLRFISEYFNVNVDWNAEKRVITMRNKKHLNETKASTVEKELGLAPYVPSKAFNQRPGLYVENGIMMHEGEPYAQIGVNFFGAFYGAFNGNDQCSEIFSLMNEYGIEYARINMGLFWPVEYGRWAANKKYYYEVMDRVVRSAEEHGIGLICSMFWNPMGFSDYCKEPFNAWADSKSKTRKLMHEYVETVVTRYKDSPAIWGWEYANEYNLFIDLPNAADQLKNSVITELGQPPVRVDEDICRTEWASEVLIVFAEIVRDYDPYNRMITSGNGEPRPSQYNQRINNTWKKDTVEEMAETLKWHNPDPIDTVSIHTYSVLERLFEGEDTFEVQIAVFKQESAKLGKPLFIGEFSWEDGPSQKIIDAIVVNKVPISALWAIGSVEYALDTNPKLRAKILSYIMEANKKMKA